MLEPNVVLNELEDLRENGFLSDTLLRRIVKNTAAADDRFNWVGVYLVNSEEKRGVAAQLRGKSHGALQDSDR